MSEIRHRKKERRKNHSGKI